mmetsp:Transcript_110943/g.237062  ORF Transcript_110943/g.237062 Transcript_110943/m.237062 type:complete len:326 (+) Transcript_110943:696-1673(+)
MMWVTFKKFSSPEEAELATRSYPNKALKKSPEEARSLCRAATTQLSPALISGTEVAVVTTASFMAAMAEESTAKRSRTQDPMMPAMPALQIQIIPVPQGRPTSYAMDPEKARSTSTARANCKRFQVAKTCSCAGAATAASKSVSGGAAASPAAESPLPLLSPRSQRTASTGEDFTSRAAKAVSARLVARFIASASASALALWMPSSRHLFTFWALATVGATFSTAKAIWRRSACSADSAARSVARRNSSSSSSGAAGARRAVTLASNSSAFAARSSASCFRRSTSRSASASSALRILVPSPPGTEAWRAASKRTESKMRTTVVAK